MEDIALPQINATVTLDIVELDATSLTAMQLGDVIMAGTALGLLNATVTMDLVELDATSLTAMQLGDVIMAGTAPGLLNATAPLDIKEMITALHSVVPQCAVWDRHAPGQTLVSLLWKLQDNYITNYQPQLET